CTPKRSRAITAFSPSVTRCSSTVTLDTTAEAASVASHDVSPVLVHTVASDGEARAGIATTANGSYTTPLFMPVGTRGAIKYLSADDYAAVGAQIVLGNTYHLMLRPGAETVAHFGGLAKFAGWDGLTLTDSGGFQVFS